MNELKPTPDSGLYEADLYAWANREAQRLRLVKPRGVDWANLAEEIDDLGKSQKLAMMSNLRVVLLHLIKWQYQPGKRKSGWRASIVEHRRRIADLIEASPSLAAIPAKILTEEYRKAREDALAETQLGARAIPERCPFTIEEVLGLTFLP
jgi:hypothetical protein